VNLLSDQKEIMLILIEEKRWMTMKEIMECLKLEYENPTCRYIIQRKLTQLEKFEFIKVNTEKNGKSRKGWGHRIFKARRRCL